MSKYLDGKLEVFEIWNGLDAYEMPICFSSHTLSETVDEISGRTKCDLNGAMQKRAGAYSYEISFEGLYVQAEANKIAWTDLRDKLRALGNFDWRITTTYLDNPTTTDVEYGNGFLSNLEKTATIDEDIAFSGTLIGNGLISATDPNV